MRPIEIAVEEAGGQQVLADKLGVSQSLISQMVKDHVAIKLDHFPGIVEAAKGKVTNDMLIADQLERPKRLKAAKHGMARG